MADKIDGIGRPNIQPSRSNAATESDRGRKADQAESPPADRPAGERVELTESAQRLRKLEARLAARQEVDEQRVAEVKERIAEGRFDLDPGRIADRLIRMDKDL
ncbi:MAG: flagellar biosynthesis anti-sigma factor FlgM [Gammaproteobacteria bacterium]|jgi:negative regulator of flagellin synthesis FlgM